MNKKILIILIVILLIAIAVVVGVAFRNNKNYINATKSNILKNSDEKKENEVKYRLAECNYNNQQLTLEIPSTWQFEVLKGDNETSSGMVVNSNYGIKFYPDENNKDKNAIIYNQKQSFGVCGTDLKTEKITTESGLEAEVGYFNSGKDWSYVVYRNDEVVLVAYNNGLEDEIAKEALNILKTMKYIDNTNIEMSIKEGTLTKTSATLVIYSKDGSKDFSTGAWFEIEKKESGKWIKLPVSSLISWNELAFLPNDDGIIEIGAKWKDIYGELESGEYRIIKELAHKVYVYAEFLI